MDRRAKILMFGKAIDATFSSSEWTELGFLTGTDEWIDRHPRLLRSLNWGDPDYKEHVLNAVKHMLDTDPENFGRLATFSPIVRWLEKNDPSSYAELMSEVSGQDVPHIKPTTSTDAGLAALADAQALLRERGPTSAVDRVHTGLHAFFRASCDRAKISYGKDATANQLLKLLLEQHPKLANFGPRSEDIRRIVRTSASIIDAFGTLRNQASLAHPNEELLGPDEALLVINLSRSLLRFLDGKIS